MQVEIIEQLREILSDENVKENVDMKRLSSFRTGGTADVVLTPHSVGTLKAALQFLNANTIQYILLGNCSNVLVSDRGVREVIVLTSKLRGITQNGTVVSAYSGDMLSEISSFAASKSLEGLEFASGIPGSLGGAIYMNAGAYGGEMKDVVKSVLALTSDGQEIEVPLEACRFGYRTSVFKENNYIITGATFSLCSSDEVKIREKMKDLNKRRRDKQPLNFPSAGSTFKRPEGYFAGKLIEDSGLKGKKIGGAMVSEKHAGFVINFDNATTKDVKDLIAFIQKTIMEKFSVKLEREVIYLPEDWE